MKKAFRIIPIVFITLFSIQVYGQIPSITSFNPTSGPIGTTVTITGLNFSTTPANNIVWFGAVKATVTAATATSLTVTVPTGATYQPITLTVNGLTATSSKPFNVTFPSSGVIDINTFAAKIDIATGSQPYFAATGDIDGDGKPDLVVANNTSGTISVYRNTSTLGTIAVSSFAAKVDFTTGSSPWGIAIGDLDGDGKLDIVVPNRYSNTISVFRNTSTTGTISTGSFAPKVDFATANEPISVAICDVDGDNKLDIAASNYGSSTASIYLNTSSIGVITTSSFAAKIDFAASTSPIGITVGDLDGDGKPDLAVVNSATNNISVLRNTSTIGTASFSTKVDFAVGTSSYYVAIGDLDGDNKPDMVISNAGSNNISVIRNTSTSGAITASSFATKVDFATGLYPYCIAIGDIDGDGKQDLTVSNYNSNSVSVFKNTSTSGSITASSFATKVDYTTGTQSRGLAIVDIDGDGKPEIASTNSVGNTFSIFQNTIPADASWYKTIGGATDDLPASIVFDGIGNFYIAGSFTGTVDFDPGTGVDSKTSNGGSDIYLSKFSNTGSYSWTKTFGSTVNDLQADFWVHNMLSVDISNNVYMATIFSGSVDFDPGTGTDIKSSVGGTDVCLIKINADGSYGWTKVFGGSDNEIVHNCSVDNAGNIFVGGTIASSNIDFDPSAGQDLGSSVFQSPFIWKINSDGSYGWKKIFNINMWGYSQLNAIRFDNSQNLFALGGFEYTMDFDPGTGTDSKTSGGYGDIFLTKLNSDYSYSNTKTIGSGVGANNQIALDLLITTGGSQFYTGSIQKYSGTGAVDMDPTSGTDIKSPVNGADFFITKLTNENTYAWTKLWTGTGVSQGQTIAMNGPGDYYVTGFFTGTMDFDPGAGVDSKTALGTFDVFLIKFNADDTYAWTKTFGGAGANTNNPCVRINNNYIYLTGSFTGTIDLDPSDGVLQKTAIGGNDIFMVKLSTGSEISTLPPTITSFTPSSGLAGSSVTITGTNFGATQGTSTVKFGATTATATSWSATQIVATVPSITDGNYTLSVTTSAGTVNSSTQFTVTTATTPTITSFTPSSGLAGSSVTITGTNFGATQGTSTVKFGATTATATSWSATQIVATVPSITAGNYTLSVTTSAGTVNSSTQFTVTTATTPTITSFTPSSGLAGSSVTITGTNFGATQGTSTVMFGTTTATATGWSATQIIATVPSIAAGSYTISVTTTAGTVNSSTQYTITTATTPTITSFTPSSGIAGSSVTITGTNFGATQGTSTVMFGTTTATATGWSATQIIATVPSIAAGSYTISVTTTAGTVNSSTQFTVTATTPTITSFTPSSGLAGSSVTITGTNFGTTQGTNTVKFGTTTATATSWSATQIVATVPAIAAGNYTLSVTTTAGTGNSSTQYAVTSSTSPPTITSFSPSSGAAGSSVTIYGSSFGATQGTSTVKFGTTTATTTSWSATQIIALVPSIALGDHLVYVTTSNGTATSTGPFKVTNCATPTVKKKGGINILICQTQNATSYQWYLNDVAVSGATKQFYVARKIFGSYSVQVVESNGCNSRSGTIVVNTSSRVSIYPNPTNTDFSIILDFEQTGQATIRIINSLGSVKKVITFTKENDSQTLPVEISNLEKGVYFVDVEVNGEKIESQKIVIL
ncbi:MAG: IPT/TIG domain-containing protein [Tenuifilaceae bacterium]